MCKRERDIAVRLTLRVRERACVHACMGGWVRARGREKERDRGREKERDRERETGDGDVSVDGGV